ncbi:MBL fold metallo-hydrolase [Flammeovirga kamogawensis]|uniref:Peptidase n=1 Tax=Flammeovirga kamogawensis TaxID=373891 RepID=A0ABX8H453_9BACT|nr:peptidase [Flammeovirga kamogawensis]MBB6461966.1 ribonuclease Z [Flammeovirga kamogawensis]QWG10429.1 peptidase [Flammeovirga kamogawensis]TRX63939.1 peptidase [Flammeovirga kamogawensis]
MFKTEIKSNIDEDICLLIKVDNHSFNYICDCGEAKNLTVKECQDTKAIFLSHTHIDHFVNFDSILRHQIGTGRKVIICGPEGIIHHVQHRIKSYCWNLIEEGAITYEVREIKTNNTIKTAILKPPFWELENKKTYSSPYIFEEKDFHVEFEVLDHKTDSIAYLFKGHDKTKIELKAPFKGGKWIADLKKLYDNAITDTLLEIDGISYKSKDLFEMIKIEKGQTLGIIMDHAASTENHKKVKDKFFGCDKVYIECFYKDEDKEFAIKNYHSYASMSGKIMKECEVKNAIPIHFSRKYSKVEIEEIQEQFYKATMPNN